MGGRLWLGRSPARSPTAATKGGTSSNVPLRTRRATRLGPRWSPALWPPEQAAATAAARWQRPPVKVKAGEEVPRVRLGVAKVVRRSVRAEESRR
jgi:hypothetical protein